MRLSILVVGLCALLVFAASPTASAKPKVDDFPRALDHYVIGGWQGPYGDGTGGSVTPALDGNGVFLDGTVDALAYAIRGGPQFRDVSIRVNLSVVNHDAVEAEQFSFLLRWRDPVFTDQSTCPPCLDPLGSSGVVVNFNLGRNALRVTEVTDFHGVELVQVPMSYPASGSHEARMDYVGDSLNVFIDGVLALSMNGLNDSSGWVGFMAYRVDVVVYSLTIVRE